MAPCRYASLTAEAVPALIMCWLEFWWGRLSTAYVECHTGASWPCRHGTWQILRGAGCCSTAVSGAAGDADGKHRIQSDACLQMSTGEGKAKVLDEKETTVYKRALDQEYKLKLKASRQIFSEINKKYPTMPFTVRSLDSKQGRLGLVECLNHGLLHPYPVLHEKARLSTC